MQIHKPMTTMFSFNQSANLLQFNSQPSCQELPPTPYPISTNTNTTVCTSPEASIFSLQSVPNKRSKFSRKNRPANLTIPKRINSYSDNTLESFTPLPVITAKSSPTASKITDDIILGSEYDAADLKVYQNFNVTKVLTIMSDEFELPKEVKETVEHKYLKLNDTSSDDISCFFDEAIEFMGSEGVTLVHCRAGISRSSTLVMAYLIREKRWTLNEAFTFTKSKRSCVAPNFGFLGQLQILQDQLQISAKD